MTPSSPTDEIVASLMAKWATSFATRNADEMVALYSKDALFYGATPSLFKGHEGVHAYFSAFFPSVRSAEAKFNDITSAAIGADIISAAATIAFTLDDGPTPHLFRLTHVYRHENDGWKIFSHHVSPKVSGSLLRS